MNPDPTGYDIDSGWSLEDSLKILSLMELDLIISLIDNDILLFIL